MRAKIDELKAAVNDFNSAVIKDIEDFRIKYLGKKGLITALFDEFKAMPGDQKREMGMPLNELKTFAINRVNELKENASSSAGNIVLEDITKPAVAIAKGSRHPVNLVKNEIIDIILQV